MRALTLRTHIALLVVVAFVCALGAIALSELAWDLFGHDCQCSPIGPAGAELQFCVTRCIEILGITVREEFKPFLVIGLPLAGSAVAEHLIQRASKLDAASAPSAE